MCVDLLIHLHSLLMCLCVKHGCTLCAYTKLTFRLHHAWHSCSVFIALRRGCYVINSPSIFTRHHLHFGLYGLTRLSSVWTSQHNGINNAWTPPYPKYNGHTSRSQIPRLYHIQGIDWQGQQNHGGYGGYIPPKVPIKRAKPRSFMCAGYEKIPIWLHVRHQLN